mgnify:FL=1
MPHAEMPVISKWIKKLEETIKSLDKDTFFIGHSIGCQTIMRYLEKQPEKTKIGGALFVAGWFNLTDLEENEISIANPWINTSINFNKIKSMLNNLTVLLSSNEPYGYVNENAKAFKEQLGAKVIILKNRGHFADDDNCFELPEALKEIISLIAS